MQVWMEGLRQLPILWIVLRHLLHMDDLAGVGRKRLNMIQES
jgi:hypothetical protein